MDAQYKLGATLSIDRGVEPDFAAAAEWFRQAAEQGHEQAQLEVAALYQKGKGVPQDAQLAVQWYTRAADQGNPLAAFRLGLMYADGDGVELDNLEGYVWLSIAAQRAAAEDVEKYSAARATAMARLNQFQLAEGDKRVQQWVQAFAARPQP
jgi:TPR repeat protein